jgi:phage gpG-like protein
MQVIIETDGELEKIVKIFESSNEKTNNALRDALFESLHIIRTASLQSGRIPYRTGTLRRSLTIAMTVAGKGLEGMVGTNLPYAALHEYGGKITRYQAWGRPTRPYVATYRERAYLREPFAESAGLIQKTFDRHVADVLGKA